MRIRPIRFALCGILLFVIAAAGFSLSAQGSATFTYQGYLELNGEPYNGFCEFIFRIYDTPTVGTGTLFGTGAIPAASQVVNGVFTVELPAMDVFDTGDPRYLEIQLSCPGGPLATILSPRQEITHSPYSIRSITAGTADSAPWSGLSDVPAGFADGIDNGAVFQRVIIISPVGTPTENGTALRNALDGISGNSATNPYLVFIEPGIYDIGTTGLQMKPYVNVQGSGEGVTTIEGSVRGLTTAQIIGANNVELYNFTLLLDSNSAPSGVYAGIRNSGTSIRIRNLSIRGTNLTVGSQLIGLYQLDGGSTFLEMATIDLSQNASPSPAPAGIIGTGGNINAHNVNIRTSTVPGSFSFAVDVSISGSGTLTLRNSVLAGSRNVQNGAGTTVNIVNTQLLGTSDFLGTANCFNNYDAVYDAYLGC